MTPEEEKAFVSACEEGILCDSEYCPYMAGRTSRLGPCEGRFCEEAWDEYCEKGCRND